MITNHVKEYKIDIGDHPLYHKDKNETIYKYDAILNVSDDPAYGLEIISTKIHWFPISEFGFWSYQPFFWITHLLNNHIKEKHNIYIHCHMGAHRSPMMAYLYLRSLGKSPEEAFSLFEEPLAVGESHNWLEEIFKHDVEYGRIPEDVVEFMKCVHENPYKTSMEIMKMRNKLDLPPKTIAKNGVRKPVNKKQIIENLF